MNKEVQHFYKETPNQRAFRLVESGESSTEWVITYTREKIKDAQCKRIRVQGSRGVFAIEDPTTETCIGFTRDKETPLEQLL